MSQKQKTGCPVYNLFDGIFPTVAARFLKEFDEMNNHAVV